MLDLPLKKLPPEIGSPPIPPGGVTAQQGGGRPPPLPPSAGGPPPLQPRGKLTVGTMVGNTMFDVLFGSPLGVDPKQWGSLVNQRPEENIGVMGAIRGFNRTVLTTGSQLVDGAVRVVTAPFIAAAGAVAMTAEAAGVTPTEAKQIFRDVNGLFIQAGLTSGIGGLRVIPKKPTKQQAAILKDKLLRILPEAQAEEALVNAAQAADLAREFIGEQTFTASVAALRRSDAQAKTATSTKPLGIKTETPPGEIPLMTEQLNPVVRDMVVEEFVAKGIKPKIDVPIHTQVVDAINSGQLTMGDIGAIAKKAGASDAEMGALFGLGQKEAATTQQRMSVLQRRINKLAADGDLGPDAQAFLDQVRAAGDGIGQMKSIWQRASNTMRAFMVSMPTTAARNATSGVIQLPLLTLKNTFDIGVQRLWNATPGTTNIPVSPVRSTMNIMEAMLNPTHGRVRQRLLEEVVHAFPSEGQQLYARYNADVVAGGGSKIERLADSLNVLNRGQDHLFRNIIGVSELDRLTRRGKKGRPGEPLEKIIADGRVGDIPQEWVAQAFETALDRTFASKPKSKVMKATVDLINQLPFVPIVGTGEFPFARFLVNSTRFIYEHQPLKALSLFGKAERARFMKGDVDAISKPLAGATALMVAKDVYDTYHKDGDKWHELTVGESTIDIRPYQPFASMFYLIDTANRMKQGTIVPSTLREHADGLLGLSPRINTNLASLDNLMDGFTGQKTMEGGIRATTKLIAEMGSRFLTPGRLISDILGEFEVFRGENEAKDLNQASGPVNLAPLIDKIPLVRQVLPGRESLTKADTPQRVNTWFKQITGLMTVEKKTALETEIDRLGIKTFKFARKTGIPRYDALVRKHFGALAESGISPLIISPAYRNRTTNAIQIMDMKDQLRMVASTAKVLAMADILSEQDLDTFNQVIIKEEFTADERRLLGMRLGVRTPKGQGLRMNVP